MTQSTQKPIFIFTSPRTCSNLFLKYFEHHPQLVHIAKPFLTSFYFGPERAIQRRSEQYNQFYEQCKDVMPTYQQTYNKLVKDVETGKQEGKIAMISDHTYMITRVEPFTEGKLSALCHREAMTSPVINDSQHSSTTTLSSSTHNTTLLPTSFINNVHPIILIRHPARTIPSLYRAMHGTNGSNVDDPDFAVEASYRWSRLLYNYFTTNSIDVMAIDADEIVHSSRQVVEKVCDVVGLDKSGVQFEWETSKRENPLEDHMAKVLGESKGVVDTGHNAISDDIDLEKVDGELRQEFGEKVGGDMSVLIRELMEDYVYLRERRVQF